MNGIYVRQQKTNQPKNTADKFKDNESIANALDELEANLPCDELFNKENQDPNNHENSEKNEFKWSEDKE